MMLLKRLFSSILFLGVLVTGFVRPPSSLPMTHHHSPWMQSGGSAMKMLDISSSMIAEIATTTTIGPMELFQSNTGLLLAETEGWVQPTALILGPFLNFLSFAMLCRVVASWYPEIDLNKLPWNLVAWPTEPLLRLVKGSIPPAFGVDITPVFWLAIFTFINEILLGPQGLLVMKMKYGI